MAEGGIRIRGARQNNLKGIDLDLPLGTIIVITGVSGSGKSSLAFDTVYAEGQRRYVETFSPYARQFLDRMDRPACDRIEGIPPAIAIDQVNPVRNSRSTVGTMTELNDHLKLLFSRVASLYCPGCGRQVERDHPEGIANRVLKEQAGEPVLISARVPVSPGLDSDSLQDLLRRQGFDRLLNIDEDHVDVVLDRLRARPERRDRLVEALEQGLRLGRNRVSVHRLGADRTPIESRLFSSERHCPDCDTAFPDPTPGLFSFNSPIGACPACRGFGRVMGIDPGLVVPDPRRSLADGAIRPWQSGKSADCQNDLIHHARRHGVALDIPWQELPQDHRDWVMQGDRRGWYGVRGYFASLESKSYRMHVRVLLSKYRSYHPCPECRGSRLKPLALAWRIGDATPDNTIIEPARRFRTPGQRIDPTRWAAIPGLCLHDVMQLPLDRCARFFDTLTLPAGAEDAVGQLLEAIRLRLHYLVDVGLGYLCLDRQSRTLSGGEVQRINLTTALGTSLVNTLFVLDEPSIGLHPRDIRRIVGILHRLRDAGNTLLVVEHDPDLMLAADRIIDMGPGPGADGGRILFNGTPADLLAEQASVTAAFLAGRRHIVEQRQEADGPHRGGSGEPDRILRIRQAEEHNLKSIDVAIPLDRLVVITGVSGSGKSTLVETILYRGLCQHFGRPTDAPGQHAGIDGAGLIDDVVLVDQSAIGRTTRSNPASYVGAFDPIRKLFGRQALAADRGYTAGTFSFNTGKGRCPGCGGNGFEHVEMQFLSDVYLRCPDCDGRRYRREVLDVRVLPEAASGLPPLSIADVLELTVDKAIAAFAGHTEIVHRLTPLVAVGLGYLQLGQPVPTLSGGEAQRLKLAAHLADSAGRRGARKRILFLFDEPTTGLHFSDIRVLLTAFRTLLAEGHAVVVIEHMVDVMQAADWIIDLGPEGGDGGGELLCAGPPDAVAACDRSETGRALREAAVQFESRLAARIGDAPATTAYRPEPSIRIHQAREHNLHNVDVTVPRNCLTVITGLSGSGKSTLAFDILFNEGQRRYLDSLNAYARQFVQPAARPDVDAITGIPPTVAIEQRTSRGGRKSTVGTLTELHHFLRLLFVRLGTAHCPDCGLSIEARDPEAILDQIIREQADRHITILAPMVVARKGLYTDLARWAAGKGYTRLRVDGEWLPTRPWPRLDRYREHDIDLPVAELQVGAGAESDLRQGLADALGHGRNRVRILADTGDGQLFSSARACPGCERSFPDPDPRLFSWNSRLGWCPDCFGTGQRLAGFDSEQTGEEATWNDAEGTDCPSCDGRRLNPTALAVRFRDRSIGDVSALTVQAARDWLRGLDLNPREAEIGRDLLTEVDARLAFLEQVGLGYLGLDRSAPTLSGGEAQRIRLAAQLGSNLQGVCYVLDEPTIGLHPRDNRMLLDALDTLERQGNTIVVVEHDEDTIRRARHVIDLGPGAGVQGGRVVAEGTLDDLLANPDSVTGRSLASPLCHPIRGHRRPTDGERLRIAGAHLHTLRNIDVDIPLGCLVAVCGVSGSGKSTLVRDVLQPSLRQRLESRHQRRLQASIGCRELEGWETVDRVLEVDQTPIGKTPRSCPATYVGFWDPIRKLFAQTEEARIRGYGPARFSFNTRDGRCPTCDGQGVRRIEMNFLPDVTIPCEACAGLRFTGETLSVAYRGLSIGQVLALPIDEAVDFFAAHPAIQHPLTLLRDVGLGYLTLGQPSPTLSGGEAQRIKLVTELAKARPDTGRARATHTLYLLDEPTVGLHMADVERLLHVLHRLVDAGNSVVVIEHNLDLLAEADWLIDLGPEGGGAGGRIVASGPPDAVAAQSDGPTGPILGAFLQERRGSD